MVLPSEDDTVIGGPESWLDASRVYGPGPDNPRRAFDAPTPWECEKPDITDFAKHIREMENKKMEDMKKKKLVSEHIDAAIDEVKAARAAAFEDIKAAADSGDIKEIRAILDMVDDLESVQEQLEAWQ